MKNFFKLFGFIALVAVIGFSMAACGGGGGGDDGPVSQAVEWKESGSGTDYKLALTDLSTKALANSTYTYILSVVGFGWSTGTVTVKGSEYTFTPRETGGSLFSISIDSTTKKVTTTSDKEIKLTTSSGGTTSHTLPVTSATATITDTTGGVSANPFVGTWKANYGGGNVGTVTVNRDLTWSYKQKDYSNTGSYAFVESTAIIYDSKEKFFGFANITNNGKTMDTLTADGGNIPFTK